MLILPKIRRFVTKLTAAEDVIFAFYAKNVLEQNMTHSESLHGASGIIRTESSQSRFGATMKQNPTFCALARLYVRHASTNPRAEADYTCTRLIERINGARSFGVTLHYPDCDGDPESQLLILAVEREDRTFAMPPEVEADIVRLVRPSTIDEANAAVGGIMHCWNKAQAAYFDTQACGPSADAAAAARGPRAA